MGQKKKPPFSSIEKRQSVRVITQEDLDQMRQYKLSLIDLLLYGLPKVNKKTNYLTSQDIMQEIKRVGRWLIKNWEIFLHDKNRNLKQIA